MKRVALLAVVVLNLAFATISHAEFNLGGEKFEGFLHFCGMSRYMTSVGIQISEKPLICQEAMVKHVASELYGGSWWSESPGNGRDGRDEKDFYVGVVRDLSNLRLYFQINYIRLTGIGAMNEFALRVDSLEYPFYWKGSYLLGLERDSPNSGFLNREGFTKTFLLPLGLNGYEQKISFDVYVGGIIGGAVGIPSGFTHTATKVSFPIPLMKNLELTPTFGSQFTFPKYQGVGKGKIAPNNPVWGEVGITFKF